MKHLIVALGITACFLAPLSGQAAPGSDPASPCVVPNKVDPLARNAAPAPKHTVAVYSSNGSVVTGSHIPRVARQYRNEGIPATSSNRDLGYYYLVSDRQRTHGDVRGYNDIYANTPNRAFTSADLARIPAEQRAAYRVVYQRGEPAPAAASTASR